MRKGIFFLFHVCLFSCGLDGDVQKIILANYQFKDGSTIVLEKRIGGYLGATTPNVTWINKKEKNGKERQVGKIGRWLDGGTISFTVLNDSLLSVQYIDSMWHQASVYTININHEIYPNDGSPYLEAK